MNSKLKVLETWIDRVWTQEDASAIHDLFIPEDADDKAHGLKKDVGIGPEEFEQFHVMVLELISDVKISIDSNIKKGKIISAECTMTATNRKSEIAKPITIKGSTRVRIKKGKIISANNHWDFLGLFEQLGLLPQDTLLKCLSGSNPCES